MCIWWPSPVSYTEQPEQIKLPNPVYQPWVSCKPQFNIFNSDSPFKNTTTWGMWFSGQGIFWFLEVVCTGKKLNFTQRLLSLNEMKGRSTLAKNTITPKQHMTQWKQKMDMLEVTEIIQQFCLCPSIVLLMILVKMKSFVFCLIMF